MKVFRTQTESVEPSVHAHYLYDAAGKRVKKLVRKQGGRMEVTHYIDDAFEHHRSGSGAQAGENNHVHVMDDQQRIALVRLGPTHPGDRGPAVQFHLGDHLGSSTVVVDSDGASVNREEFTPYGETSFGSFAAKRYRFTGKERDEESGLTYHGARYYAPWLGSWTSCDPLGWDPTTTVSDSLYMAVKNNPSRYVDPDGDAPKDPFVSWMNRLSQNRVVRSVILALGLVAREPAGTPRPVDLPGQAERRRRTQEERTKKNDPKKPPTAGGGDGGRGGGGTGGQSPGGGGRGGQGTTSGAYRGKMPALKGPKGRDISLPFSQDEEKGPGPSYEGFFPEWAHYIPYVGRAVGPMEFLLDQTKHHGPYLSTPYPGYVEEKLEERRDPVCARCHPLTPPGEKDNDSLRTRNAEKLKEFERTLPPDATTSNPYTESRQ